MDMAGPANLGRFLCDWPFVASVLLLFGLCGFGMLLPRAADVSGLIRCLVGPIRLLALLQLALWPLVLILVGSSMAGVGAWAVLPLLPAIVKQTQFGHHWLIATPLMLAVAALSWRSGFTLWQARALAGLSAGQLMLWAASSHAIDYGRAAIAAYLLHELAAGLWLGSLIGLWLVAPRLGDALVQVGPRVSQVAGWCVASLIVSGAYLAYYGLGLNLSHLLYSSYGRTLLWKLALFAAVVTIGGYNRYRVLPFLKAHDARRTLLRNVALESLLLLAIIAIAALLANTPPAHMVQ